MIEASDEQHVLETIGTAAAYEQLAEECSELAQAALKMARILRGENFTPVGVDDAEASVIEELSDVSLCCDVLGLKPMRFIKARKLARWVDRLGRGDADA